MKKTCLIFLTILSLHEAYAKKKNLIESIHCSKNRIDIALHNDLKKQQYILEDFFIEYNDDQIDCRQLDFSIVTMPAIMNLITLIWASGDRYYIKSMDAQLYHSLKVIKEIFKRLYPNTSWNGDLRPRSLVNNDYQFLTKKKNDDHIVVLFSHGLDSICTSLRHRDKNQLLLTAWGHSDCPLGQSAVWQYLHDLIASFAQKFNHTPLFFSSNYHSFMNFKHINATLSPEISSWRMQAIEGLGWAGLAAPVLVAKGYKKLYIASSLTWDNPYPGAPLPIIDENIKFAGVRIVHDAFDMTREEKCEYVAAQCTDLDIPSLTLRVCGMIRRNGGKNCCNCEKCFRTITALLLLGEDIRKFGFDMRGEEAIQRVQDYLPTIRIVDRISCFWRTLQQFAQKKQDDLDSLYRSFAQWFIAFDIDTITLFKPTKKIDWKDFVDVYPWIPERFLT